MRRLSWSAPCHSCGRRSRVVVLHYSPIVATVDGEAPKIYPFLGTSRLAEVVDRHGADLIIHGPAHHASSTAAPPPASPSTTQPSPSSNPSNHRRCTESLRFEGWTHVGQPPSAVQPSEARRPPNSPAKMRR